MMKSLKTVAMVSVFLAIAIGAAACAGAPTEVPGGLSFEAGYPSGKTAQTVYDEFDYQAAVQAYVWSTSLANSMGWWEALQRDLGFGDGELAIAIWDQLMKPRDVVMTANTDVVYSSTQYIDISATGPLVIEAPAGLRGHIWDLWQRALLDVGDIGPDLGKGGKFLVLPPGYDGEVPAGYFPARLEYSNHVLFLYRTFVTPASGGLAGAVELAQKVKVYPLTEKDAPEPNRFVLVGDRPFNADWPKDERYFGLLAQAFNADLVPEPGLALLGNLRRLGIEKGKPFEPDERALSILSRAADTGYAMVRTMAFDNRFENKLMYSDRMWERVLYNKSPQFLQAGYEEVEERAASWYQIMGAFASAEKPAPGTGQFPLVTYRDAGGEYLNGSNAYRLQVPADVPVAQFWEVPVYDVETRSLIDTDQQRPSLSSRDALVKNADGSVTLYFGPEAPAGMEKNWVKTIPGKGWFTLLRLYGPLEPILSFTWVPNDLEKVE